MDHDSDVDDALQTATQRARQAEERLIAEPLESAEVVPTARKVEQFADDIHELASDAADEPEM